MTARFWTGARRPRASAAGLRARGFMVAAAFLLCALLPVAHLAASGRADAAPADPLRDTWTLAVTQFDVSGLPHARRAAGDVIVRNLVERLGEVSFRIRLDPELAFYESYEWRRSVQETARALAARQNDRALLLFRGEPGWRYRRELRRIEEDIELLQAELARREAEAPRISAEPRFALTQAARDGVFPAPPAVGAERRFVQAQNADGFLAGEIFEFHGRFFVRLRVYALYADGIVFEDDIIFSMYDIGGAVDEIAVRLASALSGAPPARLAVAAYPPDALILIDHGFAGTGEVEAMDRPPGTVTIAVEAGGWIPQAVEVELAAGELAQVEVVLAPQQLAEVFIDVPDTPRVAVYHGARFVGETPLAIMLPADVPAYIALEGADGAMARAIIPVPSMLDDPFNFAFTLRIPPPGDRRVNNARRRFYWSFAGVWGTLATWWIASGITNGRIMALGQPGATMDFYLGTRRAFNISTGASIMMVPAIGYAIFELTRYLGAANESAVQVIRPEARRR